RNLQYHEEFWLRELAGLPSMELPRDFARPARRSGRGATVVVPLASQLVASLRVFARDRNATMYVTLLSVFTLLLARLSGQTDIVIGTPVANRNNVALEGLIGFLVNTVVLRARVDLGACFNDLVAQVQDAALRAFEQQDYPFDRLIELLNPPRDASRTPVFSIMFAMRSDSGDAGAIDLGDVRAKPVQLLPNAHARFDVMLTARDNGTAIDLELEYNTDLYRERTVRKWLSALTTLLESAVRTPEAPSSSRSLFVTDAFAAWVRHSEGPKRAYSSGSSLDSMFERCAERNPEQIALVEGDRRL